jgi:ABC-type nitrate/sulfonate/bicarbonate transport system permease component
VNAKRSVDRPGKFTSGQILPPLLAFIGLLVIWQITAPWINTPVKLIPMPAEVVQKLIADRDLLLTRHIPQTMLETLIGLGIAFVLGVLMAALLDFSLLLRRALYPLLVISQTVPIVAIAALLIVMFGFDIRPKIFVVILYCFFPITVATADGLMGTDPDLVALLRAMGADRGQIWRIVRLPAALPSLFSGLRIAATYSVTAAVVGEYITSQYGLGQYLRSALSSYASEQVFAMIIMTSVLSIALVIVVAVLERILLPWYFTESRVSQWNEPGIY